MQKKKNPKVSLEKKRSLFLQIGLIISLLVVYIAFEWKSYDKTNFSLGEVNFDDLEEEIIPITKQEIKNLFPKQLSFLVHHLQLISIPY